MAKYGHGCDLWPHEDCTGTEHQPQKCGMELWVPWYRDAEHHTLCDEHFHENEAFTMYAMECEGDMLTRRGKINKVIKLMVAAGPMCNDFATQCGIYDEVGIDSDTFTDQEVEYIESEVAKRLVYSY